MIYSCRNAVAGSVLAGVGLVGCTSEVTAPAPADTGPADPPPPLAIPSTVSAATPWACYSSTRIKGTSPARYEHRRFWAVFPEHVLAEANGETQPYRLSARTEDDELWGNLNCVIPAGDEARRFMDRLMSVGETFARREEKTSGPAATICYNGVCYIPGIVVTVPAGYGGPFYPDYQYSPSYIPDSGSDYDSHDPMPCDPNDPEHCEDILSPGDLALLNDSFDYLRQQFNDEDAAEACSAMAERFQSMMTGGRVFRGAYNTGVPGQPDWHWGAHNPATGHIHIDPWVMSGMANNPSPAQYRQLLGTALHEAAHDLFWNPATRQYSNDHEPAMFRNPVLNWDIYGEEPWSHLNPGSQSCISW